MVNKKVCERSPKPRHRTCFDIISVIILSAFLYLVSDLIDLFPWGSSNRDGLSLLVIPFFCLPVFIMMLVTDAIKMRLYSLTSLSKSPYFWIVAVLALGCVLPNILENEAFTIILFLSVLVFLLYIIFTMIRSETH